MEMLLLRTFLAVVEEGGVIVASRSLNTVPSNVTCRIHRLEEELNARLFHRMGRKLKISPAGMVLKDYAERMLELEKQTKYAIDKVGSSTGELRIGSMEAFAVMHLPEAVKRVRARHPDMSLKIEINTTSRLISEVCERKLDCAIVGGPVENQKLVAETVLTEELVLINGEHDSVSRKRLIVFPEGCAYRARAMKWSRECGNTGTEIMEFATMEGILKCVAIGLGCTLMPIWAVKKSMYAGQINIRDVAPHIANAPTVLIRHRDMPQYVALSTLRTAIMGRSILRCPPGRANARAGSLGQA